MLRGRCEIDESIARVTIGKVAFPLGVYPVEDIEPGEGYAVEFESADGSEETGDWEAWPDRYVYDVVISADRVESLARQVFALAPPRLYPILDFIGHDAYREIDPYIAYELIGADRFLEGVARFKGFLLEDGMVGFGVMSDDPFYYAFLDEHKILTLRIEAEMRPKIERLLGAYGLEETPNPSGADTAAHEHRTVLLTPKDRPDLLTGEEIVEELREAWRLVLNIDTESNVDDDGRALGPTPWRVVVRCASEAEPVERFLEVLLRAGSLGGAEEIATELASGQVDQDEAGSWVDLVVVQADRLAPDQAPEGKADKDGVFSHRWLRAE